MSMHPQTFDLKKLLHPVDLSEFKKKYWETRPLIVLRKSHDYYRPLLSIADVDHILSTSSIRSGDIRLVKLGKDIPLNKPGSGRFLTNAMMLEALYDEYRGGATIVLQFLHERWGPLSDLTTSVAGELSAVCQVNVYLTPPHEQGLGMHYDTHDVLVLQTEGRKRWRITPRTPVKLPLDKQPYVKIKNGHQGKVQEFELNAGDMIYIPRGYLHEAVSENSTSLHLTLGIKTLTWAHVVQGALDSLVDSDPRLRASLPPGFASDRRIRKRAEARLAGLLDAIRTEMKPGSLIDDAAHTAIRGTQTTPAGHLLDLTTDKELTLETRVSRRPEILHRVEADGVHAMLRFHGKVVTTPAFVAADLEFIAASDDFRPADLPGELDAASRILLVRRLIREGFLKLHHDHSA